MRRIDRLIEAHMETLPQDRYGGPILNVEIRHEDGCPMLDDVRLDCECDPTIETGARTERKHGGKPIEDADGVYLLTWGDRKL